MIMLSGDRPESSRTLGFQTWDGTGFVRLHRPGLMFTSDLETFGRSSEEAPGALRGALAYTRVHVWVSRLNRSTIGRCYVCGNSHDLPPRWSSDMSATQDGTEQVSVR